MSDPQKRTIMIWTVDAAAVVRLVRIMLPTIMIRCSKLCYTEQRQWWQALSNGRERQETAREDSTQYNMYYSTCARYL